MRKESLLLSVILAIAFSPSIHAQPPGYFGYGGAPINRSMERPASFNRQTSVRFKQDRDENGYHLRILTQGFSPEALQVKVEGRSLVVENQEAHRVENRSERGYIFSSASSSMRRRFRLPGDADVEAMQRTEEDGVIVITLPYKPYR
ncbi:MAG: Hsp20/alpha crystallin family protein [Candidatus Thiodiazotropha sp. (ex Dulcina madagascariensis)]|nr:Hsp20/alpha crystallin family protein [Candidatus Thiodiazotropha sp. (ex Dulcina madagascariensis)]MCU7925284.1 Hsp20/alpha crystallin family protein [Candidatus Thiodiazotropha sp. (ex Dulcina madagascariensis)]